jgi:hypothetical protein
MLNTEFGGEFQIGSKKRCNWEKDWGEMGRAKLLLVECFAEDVGLEEFTGDGGVHLGIGGGKRRADGSLAMRLQLGRHGSWVASEIFCAEPSRVAAVGCAERKRLAV